MGYKILLPQEIMQEGREYLESRGYELITGSGLEEEDWICVNKVDSFFENLFETNPHSSCFMISENRQTKNV